MNKEDMGKKGFSDAELGGIDRDRHFIRPEMGEFEYALLPGAPERITAMAKQWDEGTAKEYDLYRGYRSATGSYKGLKFYCFSTGMGGGNIESPLISLANNGINTFIRVGTCGAIQEDINVGDIIINDCFVRMEGTSAQYIRKEYPAAASLDVTMALMQACENLGFVYHVGVGCTTDSFFAGQYRPAYKGYKLSNADAEFEDFRQAKVLNFEREGATLFTLSRLFGLRAGMCAVVVAQRIKGEWNNVGIDAKAGLVGAEALKILSEWDEAKKKAGKKYFTPCLIK